MKQMIQLMIYQDRLGTYATKSSLNGAFRTELVAPSKPYLEQFTTFIVRAMNLTDAPDECPH